MNDEEVFDVVRGAVIWAKAEVVTLAPGQVVMTSLLGEPPICLDSLESIAMVTHLEERSGWWPRTSTSSPARSARSATWSTR